VVFGAICDFLCLCVKHIVNRWADLRQIHGEDVFGPSVGRVWRSRSILAGRNFCPVCGLCLEKHLCSSLSSPFYRTQPAVIPVEQPIKLPAASCKRGFTFHADKTYACNLFRRHARWIETGSCPITIHRQLVHAVLYTSNSRSPWLWSRLLWPLCIADEDIIFLPCGFFYLLFSLAYSQPSQIGCLPYFHTWCDPSANLEWGLKCAARRSLEMKDAKIRHLGTIVQLCRAISSQLRHILTIGKKTC